MGSFSWIIFSVILVWLLILLKKPVISHSPVLQLQELCPSLMYTKTILLSNPYVSFPPECHVSFHFLKPEYQNSKALVKMRCRLQPRRGNDEQAGDRNWMLPLDISTPHFYPTETHTSHMTNCKGTSALASLLPISSPWFLCEYS